MCISVPLPWQTDIYESSLFFFWRPKQKKSSLFFGALLRSPSLISLCVRIHLQDPQCTDVIFQKFKVNLLLIHQIFYLTLSLLEKYGLPLTAVLRCQILKGKMHQNYATILPAGCVCQHKSGCYEKCSCNVLPLICFLYIPLKLNFHSSALLY